MDEESGGIEVRSIDLGEFWQNGMDQIMNQEFAKEMKALQESTGAGQNNMGLGAAVAQLLQGPGSTDPSANANAAADANA